MNNKKNLNLGHRPFGYRSSGDLWTGKKLRHAEKLKSVIKMQISDIFFVLSAPKLRPQILQALNTHLSIYSLIKHSTEL